MKHKNEKGKLLFVSFIKIATYLGMGQATIIIIDICIESRVCSYSNILHDNKLAHGYE